MSHDAVLIGAGLIVFLGTASQLLAQRLRVPSLIVLLPVGFVAGLVTQDVNPEKLLGSLFEPAVSIAVAVILFRGGRNLDRRGLQGRAPRVVWSLLLIGVPLTWLIAGVGAGLLVGLSPRAALMTGAILVVSGPTVVDPIMAFVQPDAKIRRILSWEGTLIDPIGAVLGLVVFHGVVSPNGINGLPQDGIEFVTSLLLGAGAGAVGAGALWWLYRQSGVSDVLRTLGTFGVLVLVVAVCDAIRDETGLIAAVLMGMALANLPGIELEQEDPFFDTVVRLVIGVLFVSIPATISAADVVDVLPGSLALIALLVLVQRPLVSLLATARSGLRPPERAFIGWMDPRGIVAAATASVLAPQLVAAGIPGAQHLLSVCFLVIVGTVTVYGLTALPVARRLGVGGIPHARPLLVGAAPWVVELAVALRAAGAQPLVWTADPAARPAIETRGVEAMSGDMLEVLLGPGGRFEDVTGVYFLTENDDFNAVAELSVARDARRRLHRLAPAASARGVIAPYLDWPMLFDARLSGPELAARLAAGASITVAEAPRPGDELLFVHRRNGLLEPVTTASRPERRAGDRDVVLRGPTAGAAPAAQEIR